jgi:hypothetical protein
VAALQQAGLQNLGSSPQHFTGWVPDGYGGSANTPCFGIETLASPCLVAAVGFLHGGTSAEETTDFAVTVLVATVTEDSQYSHLQELEPVRLGSLQLDRAINELSERINSELPGIIAQYLTICREIGVPRKR